MASGETVDRSEPVIHPKDWDVFGLTMFTYQMESDRTAIYPGKGTLAGLEYCALGLIGEAGEFANRLKKVLRDDGGEITESARQDLLSELGDTFWYLQQSITELKGVLGDVAKHNRLKLMKRAEDGKLKGSGDHR